MIKFITSNQPAAQIVTVLLVFAHLLIIIITEDNTPQALEYFHGVSRYTNFWNFPIISFFFNALLLVLNVFFVSYIFNSREFFDKNTYLPGFLYFVLLSLFTEILTDYDFILSLTLFLLAMYQILKIKQNEDARKLSFNAIFVIGIAAFFNPAFLFFIPFFWLVLNSVRPFVWREMALSIAGFLSAMLIIYLFSPEINLIKGNYPLSNIELQGLRFFVFTLSFLTLLAVSIFFVIKLSNRTSIRFKRLVRMLFILFLFGLSMTLVYAFYFDVTFQVALTIAPASFIFSIPILYARSKKIFIYFLWLLLAFSFLMYLV
ncbi:MAG: hypothetical protein JJT77_07410 [Crocinitomicaceae bacterium]|nr:hypothetical protein [Crocinitomicaceae bacterium]